MLSHMHDLMSAGFHFLNACSMSASTYTIYEMQQQDAPAGRAKTPYCRMACESPCSHTRMFSCLQDFMFCMPPPCLLPHTLSKRFSSTTRPQGRRKDQTLAWSVHLHVLTHACFAGLHVVHAGRVKMPSSSHWLWMTMFSCMHAGFHAGLSCSHVMYTRMLSC